MQPQESAGALDDPIAAAGASTPETGLPYWVGQLNRVIGEGSGVIYFAVFAICLLDILLRFFFHAPTTWAFEVTIALCGIQYCLAGGNAHRLGLHIRIDAIYRLFPLRVRLYCDVFREIVISAVLVTIIYGSGVQAIKALSIWQTSGSAFNSPAPTFMKAAIPIGAFLILIQALVSLAKAIEAVRRGGSE